MIRVVLFLLSVAVLAAGFVWVADRPGDVAITWMGYRIETSVMVAALAIAALVLAVILLWSIVRGILRSPEQVSLFFRHRRAIKGYLAITRGLIAVGAGDLRIARKAADEAARLSPGDPLALLLTAQSAQMAGDRGAAERAFRAMTERDDTKLLGLRGLYIEAQRRDDRAGRAAGRRGGGQGGARARLGRAGGARLSLRRRRLGRRARCARSHEGRAGKGRLSPPARRAADRPRAGAGRHRPRCGARGGAGSGEARARSGAGGGAGRAAAGGIGRAAQGAQNPGEGVGDQSASRISPRPMPTCASATARASGSRACRNSPTRCRASSKARWRWRAPRSMRANSPARAAALAPYLSAPTRRVATLMAEIEETEHGDEGRVREWMGRAMRASGDPVWTADGVVSERWLPVSPNGRLDGFEWKVPLAEIGVSRPVIEVSPAADEPAAEPIELAPPMPKAQPAPEAKPEPPPASRRKPRPSRPPRRSRSSR